MVLAISPSSSEGSDICEICWQLAHGKHFEVYSCRACAAFFRRAVLNNFVKTKCRLGNGKCEPSLDGRFACKKCRIDRCLEAGMNPEKLQHDRDLISSTHRKQITTQIPHSMQGFLGRPIYLLSCEPDLAATHKNHVNVKFLIDHAYDFFSKNNSIIIRDGSSNLDKLAEALVKSQKPTIAQPIMLTKMGLDQFLYFWEQEFLQTAQWLTHIDHFQTLPTMLKMEILKAVWMVFARLEKFASAAEKRRNNVELCTMTRDFVIDVHNVEIDLSQFTNYRMDQLSYFLDPADRFFVDYLIDPLIELQPSIQEVTYMLTHICFRHASKKVNGITSQLDQIMETLAADLHSYYINDLKLINYAGRMAKMMKICQIFERDNNDRIERAEIANLFNVFSMEFSHPDLFCGLQ